MDDVVCQDLFEVVAFNRQDIDSVEPVMDEGRVRDEQQVFSSIADVKSKRFFGIVLKGDRDNHPRAYPCLYVLFDGHNSMVSLNAKSYCFAHTHVTINTEPDEILDRFGMVHMGMADKAPCEIGEVKRYFLSELFDGDTRFE